jgi:hypothetical protein
MKKGALLSVLFGAASVAQAAPVGFQSTPDLWHGFVYSAGTTIQIDVPGAFYTRAGGINNAGQVVGYANGSAGR